MKLGKVLVVTIGTLFIGGVTAFRYDAFLKAEPLHPSFSPQEVIDIEESETQDDLVEPVFFDSQSQECKHTKKLKLADFGTITSPNYPKNYPTLQNCEWNLESPPGTRIRAIIFDFCTKPWHIPLFDYVVISRNGLFTDSEKLFGDLNGKTPMIIRSTANSFSIRFISDAYFHFRGFKLQYLVEPAVHNSSFGEGIFSKGVCGRSFVLNSNPHESHGSKENEIEDLTDKKWFKPKIPRKYFGANVESGRSVGGTTVHAHQFPWMVALLIDERNFCGGSLIDEEHILTAAHCTAKAKIISVLLGAHNLKAPKAIEPSRLVINLTRSAFIHHPDYNPRTLSHDISIIRLPKRIIFNNEIQPICLPNKYFIGETFANSPVQVSGWGKTRDGGGKISNELQHVGVSIISNLECRKTFKGIITGNKLCVETQKEHSPCKGDSGGPLMVIQDTPQGKMFMQVGIVSFGTNSCERGKPVGFTRVTAFLDFITQVTGRTN